MVGDIRTGGGDLRGGSGQSSAVGAASTPAPAFGQSSTVGAASNPAFGRSPGFGVPASGEGAFAAAAPAAGSAGGKRALEMAQQQLDVKCRRQQKAAAAL